MSDAPPLSNAEHTLIETALALTSGFDVQQTCTAVLDAVENMFEARSSWLLLRDPNAERLVTAAFRGPGAETYGTFNLPHDRGIVGRAFLERRPIFVPDVRAEHGWFDPERVHRSGLRSVLTVPLFFDEMRIGVLGLDSPRFTADAPPTPADLARLAGVAAQAAVGIRNARLISDIEQDRRRLRRLLQERRQLRQEVDHLRDEVRDAHADAAMIGESRSWQSVLEQIAIVASAESTVLLMGETGTGKELAARAIHDRSKRCNRALVAVNCAAFPESLVESELFGYERGAFTGATERKPGKFELADRGTLFLDEVGDLPTPVQAKLLRALQEREVMRLGGTKTIDVNVRLVAATNRNLEQATAAGDFRADLFYRLSVFPIRLPPLRDRVTDIPILARQFARRFAEREGREVPRLSDAALEALSHYRWPGNVRELQNVIERATLLAGDGVIRPELFALRDLGEHAAATGPRLLIDRGPADVISFTESERHAILKALETTGWRISGRGGAADLLGLKPTTLHAKMKRLGVRRPGRRISPAS